MKTIYILTVLLFCSFAFGEDKKKDDGPVNITAEKIEFRRKENCIVLQDNIKVIWKDTTLKADKAMLYQAPNSKQYDKVVAAGNVKLVRPDETVTGQKAVWERTKNEITITGSPKVIRKDGTVVTSPVIRYNTVTKKISLQSKQGIRTRIILDNKSVLKFNER